MDKYAEFNVITDQLARCYNEIEKCAEYIVATEDPGYGKVYNELEKTAGKLGEMWGSLKQFINKAVEMEKFKAQKAFLSGSGIGPKAKYIGARAAGLAGAGLAGYGLKKLFD